MEVPCLGNILKAGLQPFHPRPSGGAEVQTLEDKGEEAAGAEASPRLKLYTCITPLIGANSRSSYGFNYVDGSGGHTKKQPVVYVSIFYIYQRKALSATTKITAQ